MNEILEILKGYIPQIVGAIATVIITVLLPKLTDWLKKILVSKFKFMTIEMLDTIENFVIYAYEKYTTNEERRIYVISKIQKIWRYLPAELILQQIDIVIAKRKAEAKKNENSNISLLGSDVVSPEK